MVRGNKLIEFLLTRHRFGSSVVMGSQEPGVTRSHIISHWGEQSGMFGGQSSYCVSVSVPQFSHGLGAFIGQQSPSVL